MSIEQPLDRETVARLSALNPVRSAAALAMDWMLIVGTVIVTERYFSWPLYVVAVFFLGTRFHALGVLMHEATHFRLFKNQKVNDWVGEVLCAWPMLVTLYGYRKNHLTHHRETNSSKDPDWVRKLDDPYFELPKPRRAVWLNLLKAISGFRFVCEVRNVMKSKDMRDIPTHIKRARLACYLSVLVIAATFGLLSELLMYWVVPLMTSFSFVMYVRSVAEHHGGTLAYEDTLTGARNVEANWLERLVFPHNVNYHLDHHLYPSVPFYHLPAVHRALLQDSRYRERAHITAGYAKGLLQECTT